jgi:hypothetical protein
VSAFLEQAVNGVADGTSAVTVTEVGGPSAALTYSPGLSTGSYSYYEATLSDTAYTAGATYVMESHTSSGTAAATFVAPGDITIASDGSSISWSQPSTFNILDLMYTSGSLIHVSRPSASPVTGFKSYFPSSGTDRIDFMAENFPTGNGNLYIDTNSYIGDYMKQYVNVTLP